MLNLKNARRGVIKRTLLCLDDENDDAEDAGRQICEDRD
jgi:hypothetical protein